MKISLSKAVDIGEVPNHTNFMCFVYYIIHLFFFLVDMEIRINIMCPIGFFIVDLFMHPSFSLFPNEKRKFMCFLEKKNMARLPTINIKVVVTSWIEVKILRLWVWSKNQNLIYLFNLSWNGGELFKMTVYPLFK